jgi:phosphoglycolate phosphatase-like HAD superfamily hydrolase
MLEVFIFDVDGVIIDSSERLRRATLLSQTFNKPLEAFLFDPELMKLDKPRAVGVRLFKERASTGYVVVVSGRPQYLYSITVNQIKEFTGVKPFKVLLRNRNSRSPSYQVKLEHVRRLISSGYEVIEFHDDDIRAVNAVKEAFPWVRAYHHEGDDRYYLIA